ncbi:MAG: nuclear transport factor 2 family protein [Alphaproteobacteria bacterium]|nr:nuclear transport factor 2 family protein [Alphaproteobacteria bacterium]
MASGQTDEANALAVVERCCDAFNRHDVEGILSDFADGAVWLLALGPNTDGRKLNDKPEIRALLTQRFRDIPDMNWAVFRHFASGNLVCSEWTVTGTPKSGPRINWLGVDIWEIKNNKIVKKDTYWKQVIRAA